MTLAQGSSLRELTADATVSYSQVMTQVKKKSSATRCLKKKATLLAQTRPAWQQVGLQDHSYQPDWVVFMDAVDACRRAQSIASLETLFLKARLLKERALLASTANYLSDELQVAGPAWAQASFWLKYPWFVAGVENLKAMAVLESPLEFRANNIFVLANFLSRV